MSPPHTWFKHLIAVLPCRNRIHCTTNMCLNQVVMRQHIASSPTVKYTQIAFQKSSSACCTCQSALSCIAAVAPLGLIHMQRWGVVNPCDWVAVLCESSLILQCSVYCATLTWRSLLSCCFPPLWRPLPGIRVGVQLVSLCMGQELALQRRHPLMRLLPTTAPTLQVVPPHSTLML